MNSKLRDLGLGEVDLNYDDKCDDKRDDQSHIKGMCVDMSPRVGQSTDLISLIGCKN